MSPPYRTTLTLALIYVVVSIGVEAAAMVVGRLRVPQDNAILAPVVLTVPPLVAAWLAGFRRARWLLTTALLLAALTLLFTALVNRLTGVHTGLLEPLVNRALAGLAAGAIVHQLARRRSRDT